MFIILNLEMRRLRRRTVLVMALLCLSGAVVATHSAAGASHMGDAGDTVHGVAAVCLAVAETAVAGAAALVLLNLARLPLLRWTPSMVPQLPQRHSRARRAAARAGPELQVFLM